MMRCSTCGYLHCRGRYLMMYRNRKKNDVNHGKWIGIGGKTEDGETPRQCMRRETFEETGRLFSEEAFCFRGILYFHYETDEEKIWIYTAETENDAFRESTEGSLQWISEDQILSLPLWEGDRVFLKKLLQGCREHFCLDLYYDPDGRLTETRERKTEDE